MPGFHADADSGVMGRWVHGESGVVFDLVPENPDVLGFANRWYPYVVASAHRITLGVDLNIRRRSYSAAFKAWHRELVSADVFS